MKCQFFLCFFLQVFKLVFTDACRKQDIGKHFSKCDDNNTREVFFYKLKDCEQTRANSTLISKVDNVPCGKRCEKGYRLNYDMDTSLLNCISCPNNTYSEGGNRIFNGLHKQWRQQSFQEEFKTSCYVVQNGVLSSRNDECVPLHISDDNSMIKSGLMSTPGAKYTVELVYGLELKHKGKIQFEYKKDTRWDLYYNNGYFKFFLDFELEIWETDVDSPWWTYAKDLEPGYHNFLWMYSYWHDGTGVDDGPDLRMRIRSIEIYGVEDAALECKPCDKSVSPEASGECFTCQANFYFDESLTKCVACPQGTYSSVNSVGLKSCHRRPACNRYDYEVASFSPCRYGKRELAFDWIQPAYCDPAHEKSISLPNKLEESCYNNNQTCPFGYTPTGDNNMTCKECPDGSYSNVETDFQCRESAAGMYSSNVKELDRFYLLSNTDQREFNNTCNCNKKGVCAHFPGWKFTEDKIISWNYLPKNESLELVLSKTVEVKQSSAKFVFKMGVEREVSQDEYLLITVNGNTIANHTYIDVGEEMWHEVKLTPGKNILTFKYLRNANCINQQTAFYIGYIKIVGSGEGGAKNSLICPQGRIRNKNDENFCRLCPEGMSANNDSNILIILGTKCIDCPDKQISDSDRRCKICPVFTSFNSTGNFCDLKKYIEIPRQSLRFETSALQGDLTEMCSGRGRSFSSSLFCYNKQFVGPLTDTKSKSSQLAMKPLFFASLLKPGRIEVTDFTYEQERNDHKTGHIFGLFGFDKSKMYGSNSSVIIEDDSVHETVKILKNIAYRIEKVRLIEDRGNLTDGILVEYSKGDRCLKDKSRNYKAYAHLECDEFESDVGGLPNLDYIYDDCTYVFRWRSEWACRSCRVGDIRSTLRTACIDNSRGVFYETTASCRIHNTSLAEIDEVAQGEAINSMLESTDETLTKYLSQLQAGRKLDQTEIERVVNLTYLNMTLTTESCRFYESIDNTELTVILVVPFVYVLTIVILLIIYFRYKRMRNQYERLSEDTASRTDQVLPDRNLNLQTQ